MSEGYYEIDNISLARNILYNCQLERQNNIICDLRTENNELNNKYDILLKSYVELQKIHEKYLEYIRLMQNQLITINNMRLENMI
jgi:hypothetical protein